MPNLHAVLVHFPIAWLVAALVFDVSCLMKRGWLWLDRAAISLYALALLAAGSAIWAGRRAAHQLGPLAADVEHLLGEHGDWAFLTLLLAVGITVLRIDVAWRDRNEARLRVTRARLLALALALGLQFVVAETADRGARLVYQHGVAVAR